MVSPSESLTRMGKKNSVDASTFNLSWDEYYPTVMIEKQLIVAIASSDTLDQRCLFDLMKAARLQQDDVVLAIVNEIQDGILAGLATGDSGNELLGSLEKLEAELQYFCGAATVRQKNLINVIDLDTDPFARDHEKWDEDSERVHFDED